MSKPDITYVEFDADQTYGERQPITALAYVEWRVGFDEFHAPANVQTDEDGEPIGDDTGARSKIPDEVRLELARICLPPGFEITETPDAVAALFAAACIPDHESLALAQASAISSEE